MAKLGENKAPHPFSKEGRALREASKLTNNTVETQQPVKQDESLKTILDRLNKLEEENKILKGHSAVSIAMAKKERYKGPRHYSFSLWGGIPVLSWKSIRKDPTKDFVFKNQYGTYESNHYLILNLANKDQVEVEVNIFNRDKTKTDPMACKVITNEDGNTVYQFNTPDYGNIELLETYIN